MHLVRSPSTDHLQCEDQTKAKLFLDKFNEAKANGTKVHRVAEFFCGNATGNLSEDFSIWADCGIMSTKLRTWLTAYQLCSLDDSVQEAPHGIITAIVKTRPNSLPSLWSSLYRHRQSMAAKKSLDMNVPLRFNALFRYWRSLFSLKSTVGRRLLRAKRPLKESAFTQKVYRMNHFSFHVNGTPMKKEQEKFMASIADDKTPLTFMGKMIREYVRMTLKAKDIVSIHYDGADAGEGLALADGSIVPPQTPEIFSIVSADQHRLKTIVTQGRVHELNAPAPFVVQLY